MSLAGRPSAVPEVLGRPQYARRAEEALSGTCVCGGARGQQWDGKKVEVVCVACGRVALRIVPASRAQADRMAEVFADARLRQTLTRPLGGEELAEERVSLPDDA